MVVIEENVRFHVGVKAFIQNGEKLLILKQSSQYEDVGEWQLPGGRIGFGEELASLESVLLREVQEECGADLKIQVGELFHCFRRKRGDGSWTFLVGFQCDYVGGAVQLNGEHTEYAWITRDDVEKYAFADGYQEAIQIFFEKYTKVV